MFEVYAVIASVLLPTGIITFAYFIHDIKLYTRSPILWTLIFESIATVLLGLFYMYSAIILSTNTVTTDINLVNNNIDDLAIINDTMYDDIEVSTFYNEKEDLPFDQHNEIEDTRNNKNKGSPNEFIQKYQNFVQASIRKKLQNSTREEKSLYQRMLQYARNVKDGTVADILENQNCFLRIFFYQALLVYSFVTSALTLLNTCQICKQCSKEEASDISVKSPTPDNHSETFGEKILDDASDNSSQNAAPVGPLFEDDSIGSSTPNLEVFSVKNTSQVRLATTPPKHCSDKATNKQLESPMLIAGKCVAMLLLPTLLVLILYFIMRENLSSNNNYEPNDTQINYFPNFNNTGSNTHTENLVKNINEEHENDTRLSEITKILQNVYAIINKFQEERKHTKLPAVTGQYLFKSSIFNSTNSTEECVGNETTLKTFDFVVFVMVFFSVTFYSKITETKLSKSGSSQNINKCILSFSILWAPGVIDLVASRFLTSRQPNIVSTLLLLLGNMDKLYSAAQNVNIYKTYGKRNAFINPAVK